MKMHCNDQRHESELNCGLIARTPRTTKHQRVGTKNNKECTCVRPDQEQNAKTPPKLETSRRKVPRPAAQTRPMKKLTRRGLGRLGLLILLLGRLGLGLAAHGDGGLWFVLLLIAQLALWCLLVSSGDTLGTLKK